MARKKNMEIGDLFDLKIISDPQISPDGTRVAFVQTKMDYGRDEYMSDIWMADVETGEVYQFTNGRGKDKNPRWSPEGNRLLFTSIPVTAENDKKKTEAQLYTIPLGGGEALRLTDLTGGVESPKWSPDGGCILFISPFQEDKSDSDVKVIKRIQYKYNGRGFFPGIRKHIFTVQADGAEPTQVTRGEFDVETAEWIEKGEAIAFVSNLEADADLTRARHIYRVDSNGGEPNRLTEGKYAITSIRASPTGNLIAFIGHDFRRGLATNQDIWILQTGEGEIKNITREFDQDIGNKLSCDVRVTASDTNPSWSSNGEHLYFTSTFSGVVRLGKVSADGSNVETVLGNPDNSIETWSMAKEGTIAYSALKTSSPIELWVYKEAPSQLTKLNESWMRSINICDHERFQFESTAGHMVEGWLMKPPGFEKSVKYPMIVEIHGGPRGAYGYSLMHEFQVLAAQGWVVMYINPFGSGGYEEDFQAGLPGHYGEQDYGDIMEAVDYVLKRFEFIDPERLGVTGGSYGGFMTNWIVTHTDRFRAAVTQRSISNWVSMFGVSDIGWTFTPWEMGTTTPWEDEEGYMSKSPIRYVKNVKTPTLIIHSEEDHRCPMEQGEQFFVALKYLGVPTMLVRFPDENHGLSRDGKPKHREKRLEHMINWFNKYL